MKTSKRRMLWLFIAGAHLIISLLIGIQLLHPANQVSALLFSALLVAHLAWFYSWSLKSVERSKKGDSSALQKAYRQGFKEGFREGREADSEKSGWRASPQDDDDDDSQEFYPPEKAKRYE